MTTPDSMGLGSGSLHASASYVSAYDTAASLLGQAMSAAELIDRVRQFSWKGSLWKLAYLAAVVANDPEGPDSERLRRLTIDQLSDCLSYTQPTLKTKRARASVRMRRNEIVLAHEQVILFLQHLVILEGADHGDAPSGGEVALWLAGANGHISNWVSDDRPALSEPEYLAAELVRISRFSNSQDALRALVRTNTIFGTKPSTGQFADDARWAELTTEAFPAGFSHTFESGLALLTLLAHRWGTTDEHLSEPVLVLNKLFATTDLSSEVFRASIDGFVAGRDELQAEIKKRIGKDGLPHSPTSLLHRPFVEVEPNVLIAASPWAVVGLLRTGLWARYLRAAKTLDPKRGADDWLSAFGYMFEDWCRHIAREAERSAQPHVSIVLPSRPGATDEVVDVVVIDDGVALFCEAKGRLVEAKVSRDAISASTILAWMEKFFFDANGSNYRGGVVRQLSARIEMLRNGEFEPQGLPRSMPVIPVIVTYDSIGESDLLYRWIEDRCSKHGLLRQPDVGPLAIARIEEFEMLLSRVARGKPVSQFLLARAGDGQNRRLDQLLYEAEPPWPPRLAFFDDYGQRLTRRIIRRVYPKPA